MIIKSIQDLPFPEVRETHPPSKQPFFAQAIGDAWYEKYKADGKDTLGLAVPEAGNYRASYAGKRCDRQLWYALSGQESSNENDLADAWRFELGHRVHDMAQEQIPLIWPGAEIEPLVDLTPIGVAGSAHVDAVIEHGGVKTVVEIKSLTGFPFKKATTTFSGGPEGPKQSAIIQGGLAARALGAERLVIVNFALENLSKQWADGDNPVTRFAAEWHFLVSDLADLLDYEIARINSIVTMVELGEKPSRTIHDAKEVSQNGWITNPAKGLWVVTNDDEQILDTGSYWMCKYCEHLETCIEDGA